MLVSSYKLPKEDKTLDFAVDKEAERLGVEAIQVGQVRRAILHGLRDTTKGLEGAEDQAEQYFFDRIRTFFEELGKGISNAFEPVKNVMVEIALNVGKSLEGKI
ncbi:hypothetical protein MTO96_038297 [Rhipicephalus appendiculatus]